MPFVGIVGMVDSISMYKLFNGVCLQKIFCCQSCSGWRRWLLGLLLWAWATCRTSAAPRCCNHAFRGAMGLISEAMGVFGALHMAPARLPSCSEPVFGYLFSSPSQARFVQKELPSQALEERPIRAFLRGQARSVLPRARALAISAAGRWRELARVPSSFRANLRLYILLPPSSCSFPPLVVLQRRSSGSEPSPRRVSRSVVFRLVWRSPLCQSFIVIVVVGLELQDGFATQEAFAIRVSKLRELSGALWDEDACMIALEEEHYNGHTKQHPKDAEHLNKPIQHYKQMAVIFGNGQATGKFALGSNEPLGSASDFAESSLKAEATEKIDGSGKTDSDAAKPEVLSGNKRKRSLLAEEDVVLFTGMAAAVKDVADAIRSTVVEDSHPDLYDAVMLVPGFTEEALMSAYGHLLDNKPLGTAFVKMSDPHRVLWLRTYLAKHYYV